MATAIDATYPRAQSDRANVIRFGVVGYGYWGPNIVRNLGSLPGASVASLCDRSLDALGRASQAHPGLKLSTDPSELIASPLIDAVAIVTPLWTHYELAKAALVRTRPVSPGDPEPQRLDLLSPISGRVLKVHQESSCNVTPGQKLLELGDPAELEMAIDVLSADAVKIKPGGKVLVEHWGGEQFYGYVTERAKETEFWFRAHANAITFGFSVEEWEAVRELFRRAWEMPEVRISWDALSLDYGEL